MAVTYEEISAQVRQLSDEDKNRLVDDLLEQIEVPDPEIERVWLEEVSRRVQADREGKRESVSYEEVMARYQSL